MSIRLGIGIDNASYSLIDSDAQAFITAAGITDATQISAINRLVKNYKGVGNINTTFDLWTGSKAIYPFVGGTATTHKFNLKDPRDLDIAFRLLFSGGWTHNNNGITANGINTTANTFLNPSTQFSAVANSYGIYNRVNTAKGYDIGAFSAGTPSKDTMITSRYTNGDAIFSVISNVYRSVNNNDARGTYIFSKNGTTNNNFYKNKVLIITSADTSIYANDNFRIGSGGSGYTDYSNHNYAFAFFSTQGLSISNVELLNDIIVQFQTDLSRNV